MAGSCKVTRHAVHEVGLDAVQVVKVLIHEFHRDVRSVGAQLRSPQVVSGVVHGVGCRAGMADGLAEHRSDNPLRSSLNEFHSERATYAVANEEKLVYAQMIHQA